MKKLSVIICSAFCLVGISAHADATLLFKSKKPFIVKAIKGKQENYVRLQEERKGVYTGKLVLPAGTYNLKSTNQEGAVFDTKEFWAPDGITSSFTIDKEGEFDHKSDTQN